MFPSPLSTRISVLDERLDSCNTNFTEYFINLSLEPTNRCTFQIVCEAKASLGVLRNNVSLRSPNKTTVCAKEHEVLYIIMGILRHTI